MSGLDGKAAVCTLRRASWRRADAHPSVLIRAIRRLTSNLEVDLFTHHGSRNNVWVELLKWVRAKACVFSTNGAYFGHSDH